MDVYFSPEEFNLETIKELVITEPDYSFDLVAAWRHVLTGRVYWAADCGCSCPSPFEEYCSLDSLTELSTENFSELEEATSSCYDDNARADFLRDVRKVLEG